VLLRLVYLSVTNVFALLRLFTVSDRDKEIEILALRHQITVLERQLGKTRPRFGPCDRVFLAALLHRLPRDLLSRIRLLVRPGTVLRWHRDLLARRHAARSRPRRSGRPRTVRSIRVLVLRLARENPSWGYRRVHGELLTLGIKAAASTVWEILRQAGIRGPLQRAAPSSWPSALPAAARSLRSGSLPEADPAPACPRRPHQRERASRIEVQVRTGGRVLEPTGRLVRLENGTQMARPGEAEMQRSAGLPADA
jgi:putative transposase